MVRNHPFGVFQAGDLHAGSVERTASLPRIGPPAPAPVLAMLAILALVSLAKAAEAQEPTVQLAGDPGERVAATEPTANLAEDESARIDALLDADARAMAPWYGVWTSFFAASTAVDTVVGFAASDSGKRIDSRVDAIRNALGLASTVLLTPPSFFPEAPLPSGATAADARARASEQKARLKRSADVEQLGKDAISHLGALVVNAGAALYLWLAEDRPVEAVVAVVGGELVSELKIFTQPTVARDALRRGDPSSPEGAARVKRAAPPVAFAPGVSVVPGGFALQLSGSF